MQIDSWVVMAPNNKGTYQPVLDSKDFPDVESAALTTTEEIHVAVLEEESFTATPEAIRGYFGREVIAYLDA